MKTSEQINELAGALAKAQGEIEGASKDSNNPFFKSKYADLASVWEACREPLSRHGLAVVQVPTADGASVKVETRLLHSSGQWIEGELSATAKDDGPQSIGSGITYLRRYMLQSFVGVAPEDDDGNQAQGQEPRTKAQRVAKEHGLKTADAIEPPKQKTAYDLALEAISNAVRDHDAELLVKIGQRVDARVLDGGITKDQGTALDHELSTARKKIEAMQKEAVGA